MRSPWKFLADLTSRRQTLETEEKPVEDNNKLKVTGREAEAIAALPLDTREVAADVNQDQDPPNPPVSAVTLKSKSAIPRASMQRDLGVAVTEALDGARVRTFNGPPSVSKDDTRVKSRGDLRPKPLEAMDQGESSPSSRDPYFDEATNLDVEIKQLRIQLAQKLYLQNVQLKKMLQRFEQP